MQRSWTVVTLWIKGGLSELAGPSFPAENLRTSTDVWHAFQFLEHRDREEFWIAALDGTA